MATTFPIVPIDARAREVETRPGRPRAPRGFCAAPWVEAVIRMNGQVNPCCRSPLSFGTTLAADLPSIWHSPAAQQFRRDVALGIFPSHHCDACYHDGKAITPRAAFYSLLAQYWSSYDAACRERGVELAPMLVDAVKRFGRLIEEADDRNPPADACRELIAAVYARRRRCNDPRARLALAKIRVIARACLDYFEGQRAPKITASIREVNVVAICNARCVHCVGLYSGDIINGQPVSPTKRLKQMPEEAVAQALLRGRDVTTFFVNGSELFLYRNWRGLVEKFAASGVRFGLSTNGMLLDADAADFLLERGVLRDINFSIDGARATTVEAIRRNVVFDALIGHIEGFLERVEARGSAIPISLSFALMRSNYAEAPELVQLVDRLRRGRAIGIHVVYQLLNHSDLPEYLEFYARERVDISDPPVREALAQAARLGEKLGVPTYYSAFGPLPEALGKSSLATRVARAMHRGRGEAALRARS